MTETRSKFDGIGLESASVFVELMGNHVRLEERLLARRYMERAVDFTDMLSFMTTLGAVGREGRFVVRRTKLDDMYSALGITTSDFCECVIQLILDSGTEYAQEMRQVLRSFRLHRGGARLRPADLPSDRYAVRNLLMEVGALQLNAKTREYRISNWFFGYFVRARYAHGTTPTRLRAIQQRQGEIGIAAETAVFAHERGIVGSRDAAEVIHIALENVGAGFDIASLRRDRGTDERRIRMIEVKAVSPNDWRFTLTQNEIEVGAENRGHYFLYLVPIVQGRPSLTNMVVIPDPVRRLVADNKWHIDEGGWDVWMVADGRGNYGQASN